MRSVPRLLGVVRESSRPFARGWPSGSFSALVIAVVSEGSSTLVVSTELRVGGPVAAARGCAVRTHSARSLGSCGFAT
jgi:hypothetical protein